MDLSNFPDEKFQAEMEPQPNGSSPTIVQETVVDHHPGDFFKRLTGFFKRKPAHKTNGNGAGPARPIRSSGQGLRRPSQSARTSNPDMRLRAFVTPALGSAAEKPGRKVSLVPNRTNARKAFWDVAAVLSLVVNAILVGVLIVMFGQVRNLRTAMNNLLGGLYGNFVEMDNASINTTIPVQAQIPLVFDIPIQQNTTVTLTQDVPLVGAHVVINSGPLSINAPANVTLPANTSLPIALNLSVPVQLTVPINLQVPVNIPLNQTLLHGPFTGLQQTVLPLYCTLDKNAQYPNGVYICADNSSTSANGNP